MFLSTGIWSTSPASQAETPHGVSGAPMSTGAAPTGWTAAFYGRSPPRGSSTPPSMWTPPAPSGPGWIWIPLSCWRRRARAGEDTRPYEMRESSGFAVGADDLGGPRAALCAAPTDRARWFGKLRRRRGTASAEFLHTQGPVARIEWREATQSLRAGKILPAPRGNPRNGGPMGAANMDTKCPSWAVPRAVLW